MLLSKMYRTCFSAVNVELFYSCISPLPRIFSLSACTDELIFAPNIIMFLPKSLLSDNLNFHVHQIQYHCQNIYTYQDRLLQSSQKLQIKNFLTQNFCHEQIATNLSHRQYKCLTLFYE